MTHHNPTPPRPHEFAVGLWIHYVAQGDAQRRAVEIRQAVLDQPGVYSVGLGTPTLVGEHRPEPRP